MKILLKAIYYSIIAIIASVALLLFVSIIPIPGNIETKIVLSGSMEPSIKTGSIVVIKPLERYKVGDTITFNGGVVDDIPTTHRITEMRVVDGEIRYITKGDANKSVDIREVLHGEIIGRVLFSIPFVGHILEAAKKPIVFALLIIVPAVVISYGEIIKIAREIKRVREKKKNSVE